MGERPTGGLLEFQKGHPMCTHDRLTISQGSFLIASSFGGLTLLSFLFDGSGQPLQFAAFFTVALVALAVSLLMFPVRDAGENSADDLEAVAEAVGVLSPVAVIREPVEAFPVDQRLSA